MVSVVEGNLYCLLTKILSSLSHTVPRKLHIIHQTPAELQLHTNLTHALHSIHAWWVLVKIIRRQGL